MKFIFIYRINGLTVQEFRSRWVGELMNKFRDRIKGNNIDIQTTTTKDPGKHEWEIRDLETGDMIAYFCWNTKREQV